VPSLRTRPQHFAYNGICARSLTFSKLEERALDALLNQLGLGAAFVVALPVYSFFKFLDAKASDEANAAIAAWIKGERYESFSIGDAVITGFESLYGEQLFRLRAFFRSAILTTCVVTVYYVYLAIRVNRGSPAVETVGSVLNQTEFVVLYILPFVIVSDYFSLFLVRKALQTARSNLVASIALSVAAGSLVIAIVGFIEWKIFDHFFGFLDALASRPSSPIENIVSALRIAGPAFFVHLWLPLFFLGGLMSGAARLFFKAVSAAQWSVARGEQHPLEAIGLMASIFVFLVTVVVQKISPLI
jgi:hypothetical protein